MGRYGDRKGDAAAGFEWVQMRPGLDLMLPRGAAVEVRSATQLRAEEAEACAAEELRKNQKTRVAEAERQRERVGRRRMSKVTAKPKQGWYRVLPAWEKMKKDTTGQAIVGTADKEASERITKIRDKLVELGPDRKFAMNPGWRASLEQLAKEMPHFSEPVALVRSSLALAEATGKAVRIPPMLLLGPAGLGKTHFSHRLADLLGTAYGAIAFDQPTYGGQLRGTDSSWSNTQTGLLFNLVVLGECANPVIVLDEVDKAGRRSSENAMDPLAQLHGALEPESARRIEDISVHIEFDASMVTYIATANTVRGIDVPILSRFDIFTIEPPLPSDCVGLARGIFQQALERLELKGRLTISRSAVLVLAHLSPRMMTRAVEKAISQVVVDGREQVAEEDIWSATRIGLHSRGLH